MPTTTELLEAARKKQRLEQRLVDIDRAIETARRYTPDDVADLQEGRERVSTSIEALTALIEEGNPFDGVPYPRQPERIYGLGSFETAAPASRAVRRRRKTLCAGRRYPFAWLRVNPCIEQPMNIEGVPVIRRSQDAVDVFHSSVDFAGRGVEYAMIMSLDQGNRPTSIAVISQGGRAAAVIDPGVALQAPILSNAVGFILGHNHPSQNIDPSAEDQALVDKLYRGSKLLGLTMFDSVIMGDDPSRFFSTLDAGMMPR